MKHKLIHSFLIAAGIVGGWLMPNLGWAQDTDPEVTVLASGNCGENVTYTINPDYSMVISGTGAMTDYALVTNEDETTSFNRENDDVWSAITSVTIEEGVTTVGAYAFYGCDNLASVSLASTITGINTQAFGNCGSLTSLTIPESVTAISAGAFTGSAWLNNQEDGLITINNIAYLYKGTLAEGSEFVLDESITSVNASAFAGQTGLVSLTIPATVETIGESAFASCSNLATINAPANPATIYSNTFEGVAEGCTVNVPYGAEAAYTTADFWSTLTIVQAKFASEGIYYDLDDEALTATVIAGEAAYTGEVAIPSSVTYGENTYNVTAIAADAFANCAELTSVTIPESVTAIVAGTFSGCTNLNTISIPESLTAIEAGAFTGTAWLESQQDGVIYINNIAYLYKGEMAEGAAIEIAEGTTSINASAFEGQTNLAAVTIPESVETIGESAFAGCSGLTEIFVQETPATIYSNTFEGAGEYFAVNVPYRCGTTYKAADYWKLLNIVEADFESEGVYYKLDDETMTAYVIAGRNPYAGEVTIAETVTYDGNTYTVNAIAADAFAGFEAVTAVTIPSSVTTIEAGTFVGCSALATITIPETVTTIGVDAFTGTAWLENQQDGVIYINNIAYLYKGEMAEGAAIEIAEGTTSINASAFEGQTNLAAVTIPESVETIGESAFAGCSALTEINAPATPAAIAANSFEGISENHAVNVPYRCGSAYTTAEYWKLLNIVEADFESEGVYYELDDETLTAYVIAGKNAYTGEVTIAESVTYNENTYTVNAIAADAFAGNEAVTAVTIPSTVTTIEAGTFAECSALATITIPETVTTIGAGAFTGTAWLENQPDGVIYINNIAYLYKGTMAEGAQIEIAEGTTSINASAFEGQTNLAAVTIPESVETIGESAFAGCTALATINAPATPAAIAANSFEGISENHAVNVPYRCGSAYTTAEYWKLLNIVEADFESEGVYYKLDDETMTAYVIAGKNAYTGEVTIAESVTYNENTYTVNAIAADAFAGNEAVTAVTIPSTVTTIEAGTFAECSALATITIPATVTTIGAGAFTGTAWLESQQDGVIYINNIAYLYKGEMAEGAAIEIAEGTTSINASAFAGQTNLAAVTIPESVLTIGESAFAGCSALTEINAPATPAAIAENTFEGVSENLAVNVPYRCGSAYTTAEYWKLLNIVEAKFESEGVYYELDDETMTAYVIAGRNAYAGEVTIAETVTYDGNTYTVNAIAADAFAGNEAVTAVTIPSTVTTIEAGTFAECSALATITIPATVTTIGAGAFTGTAWLESQQDGVIYINNIAYLYKGEMAEGAEIEIAEGTTSINAFAFAGQTNLAAVTIPASVETIGDAAFSGCTALATINAPATPATIYENTFSGVSENHAVNVPYRCGSAYTTAEYWKLLNIVEAKFESEGVYYELDDETLTAYVIAGKNAYTGEVTIAESVTYNDNTYTVNAIAANAFAGNEAVTAVTIPSTVTTIEAGTFVGCSALATITIPATVTTIGAGAFTGTAWLESQPDGVIYINNIAYLYKGTLAEGTEFVLDEGITSVSASAFEGQTGLVSLTIPESVTEIGENAFAGCTSLTEINAEGANPPTIYSTTFADVDKEACIVNLDYGKKEAYVAAPYWSEFKYYEYDTDISALENAIYIETTEGRVGGTKNISIKIKNSYPVRGFQCNLTFPEGTTINSWDITEDRLPEGCTTSDKAVSSKIEGASINMACTLNYGEETFTGNDGEVAYVNVTFSEDMAEGEYPIYITSCAISDANAVDKDLSNTKGTLILEYYLVGDANGDGKIRIGDATAILNYIVDIESDNFNKKAADANEDGKIRIGDVTAVLNMIVNQ